MPETSSLTVLFGTGSTSWFGGETPHLDQSAANRTEVALSGHAMSTATPSTVKRTENRSLVVDGPPFRRARHAATKRNSQWEC